LLDQATAPGVLHIEWPERDLLLLHFTDGVHQLSFGDRSKADISNAFGVVPAWTRTAQAVGVELGEFIAPAVLVQSNVGKALVQLWSPLRNLHLDLAQPSEWVMQDFTHDGRLDLLATTQSATGELALFENGGPAGLTLPRTLEVQGAAPAPFIHPTSCDSDGDGQPEVVAGSSLTRGDLAHIAPGTRDVALATSIGLSFDYMGDPVGLHGLDFDGDGKDDVIGQFSEDFAFWPGRSLGREDPRVLWAYQTGSVRPPGYLNGAAPLMADLDHDGARELLAPCTNGLWHVEYDRARDGFTDSRALFAECRFAKLVPFDMESDRVSEILLHGRCPDQGNYQVYALHAQKDGLEKEPQAITLEGTGNVFDMVVTDLDGDGARDLVVMDDFTKVRVYRSLGADKFELSQTVEFAMEDLKFAPQRINLLAGDYTGDGQDELVVHLTGYDGTPNVLVVLENRAHD
jgi:hypothetical protein